MSRAAQSKSRAEKKGGTSAPTPAVTHEIVPGKFTDVDWNRMLDFDEGEDFVSDIVEELVTGTLDKIYQRYIEKQLLPYTISQAKDAILTIIDWQFLACDPGEANTSSDALWQADDEPRPAVPDCWAQGSVPKTYVSMRPPSVASIKEEILSGAEEKTNVDPDEQEPRLDEQLKPWEVKDEDILSTEVPVSIEEPDNQSQTEPQIQDKQPAPPASDAKKRKRFKPHKGKLKSAGVSKMTESLEDTERTIILEGRHKDLEKLTESQSQTKPKYDPMPHSVASILKSSQPITTAVQNSDQCSDQSSESGQHSQLQQGRPPGSRDVYYDENGTVIGMAKINPEKLPSHRIKTKYYVVDPAVEAAQAHLDAMRTGRYLATKKTKKHSLQAATSDKTKLDKSSILDYRSTDNSQVTPRTRYGQMAAPKSDRVTPLPPPMIESMELAPGVVVREGDRVKKGPRQVQRNVDKLPSDELLRPVGASHGFTISVQELLGSNPPVVRIHESTPVPPIMPRSTARPKIST